MSQPSPAAISDPSGSIAVATVFARAENEARPPDTQSPLSMALTSS